MEEKKVDIDTKDDKKDTKKQDMKNKDKKKQDKKNQNTEFTEVHESALLLALLKNDLITKEEYQWCLEQLKK